MTTGTIVFFVALIWNVLLLLWWRHSCEWEYPDEIKFPTRGHVLILALLAFAPIWNCVQAILLTIIYIVCRCNQDLHLKKSKFNKFWFDTDKY